MADLSEITTTVHDSVNMVAPDVQRVDLEQLRLFQQFFNYEIYQECSNVNSVIKIGD